MVHIESWSLERSVLKDASDRGSTREVFHVLQISVSSWVFVLGLSLGHMPGTAPGAWRHPGNTTRKDPAHPNGAYILLGRTVKKHLLKKETWVMFDGNKW